jgi:exodeoxyribonuclease VII small subunit
MDKKTINKMTFEQGLEALEKIVRELESGDTPLKESFAAFEEGKAIQKHLEDILVDGDRRIRVLTESGEEPLEGEAEA